MKSIIVDVTTGERMTMEDARAVAEPHLDDVLALLGYLSPADDPPLATYEGIKAACDVQGVHLPWWALGLALEVLVKDGRARFAKTPMPSPDIHIWDEYRWGVA